MKRAGKFYGMRQNMDISHPVCREYSERVIRKIAEGYAKPPGVIGWQVDGPLRFYLDYSGEPQSFAYAHEAGTELLSKRPVAAGERLALGPWDLAVVRE